MKLANLIPILGVADPAKTLEFYRDALNFEVMDTYEPDGKLVWALLKSGDVELMVEGECPETGGRQTGTSLYFYPDDIEGLYDLLRTRGYPVSDRRVTFYGMKEFDLKDPDGYHLCFGQETSEPTTD